MIRPALPCDGPTIAALLGRADPGAVTLVAVEDDAAVGVVRLGVGGVAALAVAPRARRQGVGTALLIALADRLGAIGERPVEIAPGADAEAWFLRRGAVLADGMAHWPDLATLAAGARAARLAHLAPPLALAAAEVPGVAGAPHPTATGARARARVKQRLGDAFGLTDFGVNRVVLAPGVWSSIPHRHSREDEFLLVLQGTPTLVSGGETRLLHPGDCAGFAATGRAHHLENRSPAPAVYLEIGSRRPHADEVDYPGEDLRVAARPDGSRGFVRRDGTPVAED